ncbi:FKBP-type peptidyl-prolyl cis-trans isomerase [Chitinophaga sp. GCM10012297]|uniref:Peptidyl-prolyl cis-trans isomerase n=1 Tax=Chitinophaga chungangae TaxID=2821488 RepID=A0ABS3YAQ4_9BACT|nr:FKBP-type peptidyl-prolyl cis-trans isomerase [Chitinophaga chungangae]MBO9151418.1 FKBP-type peptidyl-prolyl cis-trans isomerase [Chitinophaga chungangae]
MLYRRILTFFLLTVQITLLVSCSKETPSLESALDAVYRDTDVIRNYLVSTRQDSGVQYHPSGVVYKIMDKGNEKDTIHLNQVPVVTFTRRILGNPRIVEQSPLPTSFDNRQLKDHIAGWQIGLQLITKGGRIILYIPSRLAFGEIGVPGTIPPNAILECDVSLINIK